MNVIEINVPRDIEYISDWKEFNYPQGHLILDKTICGCGFTEYCLCNSIPTILCSPRKTLLENKEKQHNRGENPPYPIYYFKNEIEESKRYDCGEDIQTTVVNNLDKFSNEYKSDYIVKIKQELVNYLNTTTHTPKIVVTYDSLHYVLEVLGESVNNFAIVIDEFQAIFMDSAFKADVELDFVEDLKKCPNVLYLSATPMLEKYLDDLEYFKDLPFYKLIWDRCRVERVRIERRIVKSINKEIETYITNYRNHIYPTKVLDTGEIKESHELVVFVNSIKSICDIIKKNKLTPEETNIICSKSSDNIRKLGKLGHTVGSVPTQDEPNKMFTFCTRTTYLGADFYSTSAFTIICSDCNIKTLIVDISLDLPQIVGRQRLRENVFRNEVLFLYKANTKADAIINKTQKEFDEMIEEKRSKTNELLEGYQSMTNVQKRLCAEKWSRDKDLYTNDFLGVSKRTGEATYNYLVEVANRRSYDVSRKEYQDIVTIKRGMESVGLDVVESNEESGLQSIFNKFEKDLNSVSFFEDKMKVVCDYKRDYPQLFTQFKSIMSAIIPSNIENYINLIGYERCRACDYEEKKIQEYIKTLGQPEKEDIYKNFEIGKRYSSAFIKQILSSIYSSLGLSKTPKATDIEEYFELKDCQVIVDGKKTRGYLILNKKEL